MHIFEEGLFFKLRTTVQQKTVKLTYLVSVWCWEAGGRVFVMLVGALSPVNHRGLHQGYIGRRRARDCLDVKRKKAWRKEYDASLFQLCFRCTLSNDDSDDMCLIRQHVLRTWPLWIDQSDNMRLKWRSVLKACVNSIKWQKRQIVTWVIICPQLLNWHKWQYVTEVTMCPQLLNS